MDIRITAKEARADKSLVGLSDRHVAELRESGLSDSTIQLAGFKTVSHETAVAAVNMPWLERASGDYLLLECRDTKGSVNYRVKPPVAIDGRKYLSPYGVSSFICATPGVLESDLIVITEGEKKCWALHQCGFPAIGLSGVWNWQIRGGKFGNRQLIPDLAAIQWVGKQIVILFDTDEIAKVGVVLPACELESVLHAHGAKVSTLWLPTGARDPETGLPNKMAVDDYLAANDRGAVVAQIESAVKFVGNAELSDYRQELIRRRLEINSPGIYIDRSPTGSGKSFADKKWLSQYFDNQARVLVVLPSHVQSDEFEKTFPTNEKTVAKYPPLNKSTCKNLPLAESAIMLGLSPTLTVCRECPFKGNCAYKLRCLAATCATIAIATHKRTEMSFEQLTEDRQLVVVQESALELLVPAMQSVGPFQPIAKLAESIRSRKKWGTDADLYFLRMIEICGMFIDAMELGVPQVLTMPKDFPERLIIQTELIDEIREEKIKVNADAIKLVLGVCDGRIRFVNVGFDHEQTPYLIGAKELKIDPSQTVLFSDATADAEVIRRITVQSVIDITPDQSPRNQHPIIQVDLDINSKSSVKRRADVLRTMILLSKARLGIDKPRIGVITHSKFAKIIKGRKKSEIGIGADLRKLITKVSWFWGADSRGSNDWIDKCDALIVFGTPRPNQPKITETLLQMGLPQAVDREGRWTGQSSGSFKGHWCWNGKTESGQIRTIRSVSYADHDYRAAHEYCVSSELVQSVGRARAIMSEGIPCFVASNHEIAGIGVRLIDDKPNAITEIREAILRLKDRGTSQVMIAKLTGISQPAVSRHLKEAKWLES